MSYKSYFGVLLVVGSVSASAGDMGCNNPTNLPYYLKAFVGATAQSNQTATVLINGTTYPSENIKFNNTGPIYGFSLGYQDVFEDSFGYMVELELSHSSAKVKDITYNGVTDGSLSYNQLTGTGLFLNGYVDYLFANGIEPYLGIGIGGANTGIVYQLQNTQALNPRYGNSNNFAYQGILGFNVALTQQIATGIEYRYRNLGTHNITQGYNGELYGQFNGIKNSSNNILINFKVGFDGIC